MSPAGSAGSALPPDLAERARRCARGQLAPVPVRRAATVVLLRDGPAGPEAFLLRRVSSMAFAAGMHVFPGGGVDPRDADGDVGWAGPGPGDWAARLGCDGSTAQASVCAAVRETFEESGVLLAGSAESQVAGEVAGEVASEVAGEVVGDTTAAGWEADRLALLDRSLALSALLHRRGLVLRSDLLGAWAHWVTPRFEHRRYDTAFFVAAVPAGQAARHVSSEAESARWVRPADAVAACDAGELAMLAPTRETLQSLVAYERVADVLAAAGERHVPPLVPGWVDAGGAVRLLLPWEPGWPGDDPGDR